MNLTTERKTGAAFPSPFKFQKYGQSGLEISELFAKTAAHADEHRGHPFDVRPGAEPRAVADADELRRIGAAAAERRGLGAVWPGIGKSQTCPASWRCARAACRSRIPRTGNRLFCRESIREPTSIPSTSEIDKLIENIRSPHASAATQRRQLDLLPTLNAEHRAARSRSAGWNRGFSRSSWPSACRPRPPTPSTWPTSRSTFTSSTGQASTAGKR